MPGMENQDVQTLLTLAYRRRNDDPTLSVVPEPSFNLSL